VGSVSRCRWCTVSATFAGSVCVKEKEGHVPIILRASLYVGFLQGCALLIVLEPASSVFPTLARTSVVVTTCLENLLNVGEFESCQ